MPASALPITASISALVCDPAIHGDAESYRLATVAFADTIGVALAGAAEPVTASALQVATSQFAANRATATPLLGTTHLSPSGAAFVNAIAAHALDFDDVSSQIEGHPSALLVPVLLALAEGNVASGTEVLDAYLVGVHVASSVAAGLPLRASYARGWHMTSVLGALGAVSAASRLRRLSAEQARVAIGIAGSIAAGSRASFGTMVKPLHVGITAAQAILAVELAQTGFSANPEIIEAPLGFLDLHSAGAVDLAAVEQALSRPIGAATAQTDVKMYPCCAHTHRMIDATLAVRRRLIAAGVDCDICASVAHLRITTAPGGTAALLYHRPRTGTEAKFSAEYAVCSALIDGAVTEATFSASALSRPTVRSMMELVEVEEQDLPPHGPGSWSDSYAVVEISLNDGTTLVERVDIPRGSHLNPPTAGDIAEKFFACARSHPGGAVDPERAFALVGALPDDPEPGRLLRRVLQPRSQADDPS